jgi:hypothetical protein
MNQQEDADMTKHNANKVLLVATLLISTLGLTSAFGVPGVLAEEMDTIQAPRTGGPDSSPFDNSPLQAP